MVLSSGRGRDVVNGVGKLGIGDRRAAGGSEIALDTAWARDRGVGDMTRTAVGAGRFAHARRLKEPGRCGQHHATAAS